MKKNQWILGLIPAICLLASCQREPFVEETTGSTHTVTVTVSSGLDGKTAVVEEGTEASYVWTTGDEAYFHIYENDVEATSVSMALSEGNAVATFTATFPDRSADSYTYSAIYARNYADGSDAVPSVQKPTLTSFDPAADILVSSEDIVSSGAPASSLLFTLVRMASVNKMTLKGLTAGDVIKTVVLESSDKEFAAGSRQLVLDYSALTATVPASGEFPVWFVARPVQGASFSVSVETTGSYVYVRDNFTSTLTFETGTVRRFGIQLGSYRKLGGSQQCPWILATTADVEGMRGKVSQDGEYYFKAVADIDLSGVENWVPLNYASPYGRKINLDGGHHVFSGFHCSYAEYPSFFGVLYGTVKDLTFDGAAIDGTGGTGKAGVLGGYIGTGTKTATVSGVTVINSTVTGKSYAGGLGGQMGASDSIIKDCQVINTTVSSTEKNVGGFIGYVGASCTFKNCSASNVTVSSSLERPGGFIGYLGAQSVIRNCSVNGATVTSVTQRAGGMFGQIDHKESTIYGCSADNVNVSAPINVGGFVGVCYDDIVSCSSSGTISSPNTTSNADIALGGLVGYLENCTVTGCSSSVTINQQTNGRDIGGLVGKMLAATIEKSFATGNVSGKQRNVGGLVGLVTLTSNKATIKDCYCTGSATGDAYVGGLLGLHEKGTLEITDCYATGAASGTAFAIGGLVGVSASTITVSNSAAWGETVSAGSIGPGNWSSAAVTAVTFPTCTMTNNYRNPNMHLTAYWGNTGGYTIELTSTFQHPDVSTTHPLTDSTGAEMTDVSTSNNASNPHYPQYPYHGKVEAGKTLSQLASTTLGWDASVWNFSGSLPMLGTVPYTGPEDPEDPSGGETETHPWDANRGVIVTPDPATDSRWRSADIDTGIKYYGFRGTDEITGVYQDVYVLDLDLSNPNYEVHFSYTPESTVSQVFSAYNAVAAINGTYELGSVFTRVDGQNWSVLRNDTITSDDQQVPNWKSEGAVYVDETHRGIRIGFDGKGKTLDQLRSFYRSNTWPNLFSSAPMLLDDFEPVGTTFVPEGYSQSYLTSLPYEHPWRHQGVRHPRTAVALTEHNHFLMIVADGRYTVSNGGRGFTASELTRFLVQYFNPRYALNMDGGGSSTMCVEGRGDSTTHVVNYPCDNRGSGSTHNHSGERTLNTHIYITRK